MKRAARGVLAISHILATRHVATAWRVSSVYRKAFESSVRTATDNFGTRSVSLTIRSELEIRSPSGTQAKMLKTRRTILLRKKHECGKHYCSVCNANREAGHLCYMQPLKYCTYSTILKGSRIHGTPIQLKCTIQN